MRQKKIRAKQIPVLNQTRLTTEPCPTAVYFRIVRRALAGKIWEALRMCLLRWVLLGISSIKGAVMENVASYRLMERLIATLIVINIRKPEIFTMFGDAKKVKKRKE